MIYQECLKEYIVHLKNRKYSNNELRRKKTILQKWYPLSLILFLPESATLIKEMTMPVFYYRDRVYSNAAARRIRAVQDMIKYLHKETWLNLNIFIEIYKEKYLKNQKDGDRSLRAILDFFRGAGFFIRIESITEKLYQESIRFLTNLKIKNRFGGIQSFMIFCYEQGWLNFNPHKEKKDIYSRALEYDFLGEGVWMDYLRKYISYLRNERNLSPGGIDYRIKKLKILCKYLNLKQISSPSTESLKEFIESKRASGTKNITLAKDVYEAKYFFNYLIKEKILKENPAINIKIKDRFYSQGEILTEKEIIRVIELFEDIIYKTSRFKTAEKMKEYFRAVRDKLIFVLFVYTGLRSSEAGNIKLSDIDSDKKTISVKCKGNREVTNNYRDIYIDEYLWQDLQRYLKIRNYPSQEYLFINWDGSALRNSALNPIIKTIISTSGIKKKISPHRLRGCATINWNLRSRVVTL